MYCISRIGTPMSLNIAIQSINDVLYLMNLRLMLLFPLQLELLLTTPRRLLRLRLLLLHEQLTQPLARRLLVWERPRQPLLGKLCSGGAGVGVGKAVPHALHRRRLRVLHLGEHAHMTFTVGEEVVGSSKSRLSSGGCVNFVG